jgi:hypothetical protein
MAAVKGTDARATFVLEPPAVPVAVVKPAVASKKETVKRAAH